MFRLNVAPIQQDRKPATLHTITQRWSTSGREMVTFEFEVDGIDLRIYQNIILDPSWERRLIALCAGLGIAQTTTLIDQNGMPLDLNLPCEVTLVPQKDRDGLFNVTGAWKTTAAPETPTPPRRRVTRPTAIAGHTGPLTPEQNQAIDDELPF